MASKFSSRAALPQCVPARILIVGGGPSGIAALRALLDDHSGAEALPWKKSEVALYERRADVGGVWYLEQHIARYEASLPAGTAQGQWPLRPPSSSAPAWPSPAYPALRGNVLPRFLSFSSAPFPAPSEGETFPTLDETHAYLRNAAQRARDNVRCGMEVLGAWELGDKDGWAVRVRDWNEGGSERTEYWDALVVATGWYDAPIYPPVPGLASAVASGLVHHAKWYRTASTYALPRYAARQIVVVGNGNSANDAAAHLAQTTTKERPVLRSVIEAARPVFVSLPDERIRDVPAVKRYVLKEEGGEQTLDLELVDGTVIANTVVLLGVGYEAGTIPWVHLLRNASASPSALDAAFDARSPAAAALYAPLTPPPRLAEARATPGASPTTADADIVDAWPFRLPNLHMHCVHAINPSLSFVGLPVTNTPFVLADLHARYIRCIYERSILLPSSRSARQLDETQRVARLIARRAEVAALDAAMRDDWARAREAGEETALAQAAAPQVGPEAYHVIVSYNEEQLHALHLRAKVVEVRPWLDEVMDSWDDEREKERKGMYERKRETLIRQKKRREEEEKIRALSAKH